MDLKVAAGNMAIVWHIVSLKREKRDINFTEKVESASVKLNKND